MGSFLEMDFANAVGVGGVALSPIAGVSLRPYKNTTNKGKVRHAERPGVFIFIFLCWGGGS